MWSFQLDQNCLHLHCSLCIYLFVCTNVGLHCSLLKLVLDIHEIVASVSNRDKVFFLIIVTGKCVAYFMLLNLTLIISLVYGSHYEELILLSGLSEPWVSLVSSGSDCVFLDVHVCPVISLTWLLVLWWLACVFVWVKWAIMSYTGIMIIVISMVWYVILYVYDFLKYLVIFL